MTDTSEMRSSKKNYNNNNKRSSNTIKRVSQDGVPFTCQRCGKTTTPQIGQIIVNPDDKNFIEEFCSPCSNVIEVGGYFRKGDTSEWGYRHG